MHGGAAGSGAPFGNKNALKHGEFTREAIKANREIQDILRDARDLLKKL